MMHYRIYYTLALFVLLFCSCNTQDKKEAQVDSPENIQPIKEAFDNWLSARIQSGEFFGKDSCSLRFLEEHSVEGNPLSVPDSSNLTYYYTDINQDGQEDALITFIADICDGGNGAMWTQYQVLVLSHDSSYIVNDSFFDVLGNNFEGIVHVDSVFANKFWGTLIEFKNGDGHCCPSVREPFTVVYEKPVINFVNPKFKPTIN
jgi:hypothetical protein